MDCTPIIIYTNKSYSDIFDIAIDRINKYATNMKIIIFSDYVPTTSHETILYNNDDVYSKRLFNCFTQLGDRYKYILFSHENNILFNHVNAELITHNATLMDNNKIDQLRLFKGAVGNTVCKLTENIYKIQPGGYLYSVQPALWNLKSLHKIMKDNHYDYRNIELNIDPYMLKYNNCYYFNNEKMFKNTNRHESSIYPIIHVTHHGKWVYSENVPYIDDLTKEYDINLNVRGYF